MNLIIPGPVSLVAPTSEDDGAMPRIDELLVSVRDFLHNDVMAQTQGRTNFMARVAGNSLDIVLRDATIGPELRRREKDRLATLLDGDPNAELVTLKWELVNALRDSTMPLDQPGLVEYLRESVVNQVAIDQPRYSGYVHAASVRHRRVSARLILANGPPAARKSTLARHFVADHPLARGVA